MTSPVVYVDVDDTLVRSFGSKRMPISSTIRIVRELKMRGAELSCWSRGGGRYAREIATELGLADCFTAFLPKPQMLIDDAQVPGWGIVELHPTECTGLSADEILAKLWS